MRFKSKATGKEIEAIQRESGIIENHSDVIKFCEKINHIATYDPHTGICKIVPTFISSSHEQQKVHHLEVEDWLVVKDYGPVVTYKDFDFRNEFFKVAEFDKSLQEQADIPVPINMERALEMVKQERMNQVYQKGYIMAKDSQYEHNELALACAAYAIPSNIEERTLIWPFEDNFKPTNRLSDMVKAAALALAEIERQLNQVEIVKDCSFNQILPYIIKGMKVARRSWQIENFISLKPGITATDRLEIIPNTISVINDAEGLKIGYPLIFRDVVLYTSELKAASRWCASEEDMTTAKDWYVIIN